MKMASKNNIFFINTLYKIKHTNFLFVYQQPFLIIADFVNTTNFEIISNKPF